MNPKQIITLIVCIVVIVACGAWIYKRWRDLNPRPVEAPMTMPMEPMPAPAEPGQ